MATSLTDSGYRSWGPWWSHNPSQSSKSTSQQKYETNDTFLTCLDKRSQKHWHYHPSNLQQELFLSPDLARDGLEVSTILFLFFLPGGLPLFLLTGGSTDAITEMGLCKLKDKYEFLGENNMLMFTLTDCLLSQIEYCWGLPPSILLALKNWSLGCWAQESSTIVEMSWLFSPGRTTGTETGGRVGGL